MSTIPCTIPEFNSALSFFLTEIKNLSNNQDSIGNLWKGLLLHYMGINEHTDEEIQRCAAWIQYAEETATRYGWLLEEPNLERDA